MADIYVYGTLINDTESGKVAEARQVFLGVTTESNGQRVPVLGPDDVPVEIDVQTAIEQLNDKIPVISEETYSDNDFPYNDNPNQ